MKRRSRLTTIGVTAAVAVSLAACSNPADNPSSESAGESAAGADEELSIGFFGFAKANSFAQATWAGIQEVAAENNATATFIDPNFDGATQVNQLQDAITSQAYDVVILQANDGTAMVNPVKQAVAAGITVVVEFTPVGGDYSTAEAQVEGTINLIDPPTANGEGLAKMALDACPTVTDGECTVAYLQGFENYPLDAARTKAAVEALEAGGVTVISNLVGGYTADTGRAAMQNLLQAHPDVDVVIGSAQALGGAAPLAEGKKITFVGNGASTQAYEAVQAGEWYSTYALPEKQMGAKAAELGLAAARGEDVPESMVACDELTDYDCLGTAETLAGKTADYSD